MSGLNTEAVTKKLQSVNPTPQSIQTVSLWLIHHKKHSSQIVDLWLREVLAQKKPQRLLTLIYLANDIVQNCRKKFPPYLAEFKKVLPRAFQHAKPIADPKTLNSVKRVIDVWKERGVYDPQSLSSFYSALSSEPSTTPPYEDKATFSPPSSKQAKVEPEQEITAASILAEPKKDPEPPSTSKLVEILERLENPASADAITREKIASFPEAVANPALLKQISTNEQAEQLLTIVKDAEPTVNSYCKRLSAEMEERRGVQGLLTGYIRVQKEKAERSQELLNEFRERRLKLQRQREEIHKHYESLPDLEKLPNPNQLAPLPSAGELFMK